MLSPLQRLQWPMGGLSENWSFTDQEPATTVSAQNVRSYDPQTGRARGAQRPGYTRTPNAQVSGANQVQSLTVVTPFNAQASSATSLGLRSTKVIAVAAGNVKVGSVPLSSFSTPTGGSGEPLDPNAPVLFATDFRGDVYWATGNEAPMYYDVSADTVSSWTATSGTFPQSSSYYPRLITTWNGRIAMSGVATDPHNWYLSAIDDAFNWDTAPSGAPLSTQAVTGNSSENGKSSDKVTCLFPFDRTRLVFGCDHSIYLMQGNPMRGGSLARVTDVTGMAWGMPVCKDKKGIVYFVGRRGGFYAWAPGQVPEKISEMKIDERLADLDSDLNIVNCLYDDRCQVVMIYITPLDGSATTHYAYDIRNGAFFPDVFATAAHSPTSVAVVDGDDPDDRTPIIGCQDGYIRARDMDATVDDDQDSTAIDSYVWLGPIQDATQSAIVLKELQAVIASGSSDVTIDVFQGDTPEEAFASTSVLTETVSAGRNPSIRGGALGQSLFIRLRNANSAESWSLESLAFRVKNLGVKAQRWFQ